jgi:uncharacterized protein
MRMIRQTLAAALFVALSTVTLAPADARVDSARIEKLALTPVTIATAHGERHLRLETARTPAEQEKGLMYRTSLPTDGGMIFLFPGPARPLTFWMKNTVLPLDIIFIREDGTIAHIAANAKPYSEELIDSVEPATTVVEIIGGGAAKLGIAEGDKVRWR